MTRPVFLTLLLSWGRPHLLEKTIHSYFRTIRVSHRLIAIDNGSDETTRKLLQRLSRDYGFQTVFLKKNSGGQSFNAFLGRDSQDFVHFSENDVEYLPGWDEALLEKMATFRRIGQLSPYAPYVDLENGEIAIEKPARKVTRRGKTIYLAKHNVGTTSIVRNDLFRNGLRWQNVGGGRFRYPADGLFSQSIKRLGWQVAWNDRHTVKNLGHLVSEMQSHPDYYIESYANKNWLSQDALKERLARFGYTIQEDKDGRKKIVAKEDNAL